MVAALGALAVNIKAAGVGKAVSGMGKFQSKFGQLNKTVGPQVKKLSANFAKMGLIMGGVFASLIASSPLLRARMEILGLRIRELVRVFGDALAPVIEFVTDLIEKLTDWFFSLDQPVQDAIVFGGTFVIVIGLLAMAFTALAAAMSWITVIILAVAVVAALLYLAWETNFLGIQELTETVFAAIGVVIDAVIGWFKGMVSAIMKYINAWIGIFEGVINFFKSIFAGDLEGALDAILSIFENIFRSIAAVILWPLDALQGLIKGITGSDFLGDMMRAGKAFLDAFIEGVQKAVSDAAGIVKDILEWFGEFFGGSLPERGPLKHVVSWGQDFGQAYVKSVGAGFERSMGDTINRNFNIDTIALSLPGLSNDNMDSFASQFDSGIRRATL